MIKKTMNKNIFEEFIETYYPADKNSITPVFQRYLDLLWETNAKINLVSRKTCREDYWTIHFLDSILPAAHYNFSGQRILDFGSGGGLPGIPLKIICPTAEVYLLDSISKKMQAVKNIIKTLDLHTCFTIISRLEDLEEKWDGYFDLIICRSVKILPRYKKKMLCLLKRNGRILLYKSRIMEDIALFDKVKIYEMDHPYIGQRKIVEIMKV